MAVLKKHCLNIGCGLKPRSPTETEDWVNLDYQSGGGVDVVRDARRGLPFADVTFDHALLDNFLEHFCSEDVVFIINEVDRVLKI